MAVPKFLKKMASMVPKSSLKQALHQHLSGYDKGRSLANLHASELTRPEGFCPRFYAISDQMEITKSPDRWLTTSEQITFEIGRMLQDRLVNWYADINMVIGHWKCLACNQLHQFQARPVACVKCGCKGFKPEEVRFVSATSGASCGVDMLLKQTGNTKLTPVEVKSIDKDQFKTLIAPMAEHKARTALYLDIIDESGHNWSDLVDTKEARILYISKGGYGTADADLAAWGMSDKFSPIKEYTILKDSTKSKHYSDRAQVVKDYRDGKVGMPCGICSTAATKRAQTCSRRVECFSGAYPPVYDWQEEAA